MASGCSAIFNYGRGCIPARSLALRFPAFQPSIATGGALFTRREGFDADFSGYVLGLDLSKHIRDPVTAT